MTRAGLVVAAMLFASCAKSEVPEAYFWKVSDFASALDEQGKEDLAQDFGGWTPRQLYAPVGTPLFFEDSEPSVLSPGLVMQPGVSGGARASFVITEIWKDHPVTWIQPVWVPRVPSTGAAPNKTNNLFSVDVNSTFYSPYWQLELVFNEALGENNAGFSKAREVFELMERQDTTHAEGPLVYCPFVPSEDVRFARSAAGLRDPLTRVAMPDTQDLSPRPGVSEGHAITYVDFGANRFSANNQLPVASRAYFWVKTLGGPVLPIAAVLPNNAKSRSFVTRVDVTIPPTKAFENAGVYVPTSRPKIRENLINLGLNVPVPVGMNDGHDERALQMAMDASCFTTDIATCKWLDSEAALIANGLWLNDTTVQLAIATVGP